MKKLFALALVIVMVLSMVPAAFAATVENRTTHEYDLYQIFKGTQNAGDPQLGNIEWGANISESDGAALIAYLKVLKPEIYGGCTDAKSVAVALAGDGTPGGKKGDAENFANIIVDYISGAPAAHIDAGDTSIDLPAGYYLLIDVTSVDGTADANNPALLQVTNNGDITIAKKYDVPIDEKKINVGGSTGEADVAEYSIGDTVEFVLRVTLPMNVSDFSKYKLVFHDTMSAGLTFDPSSVEVTVGSSATPVPASNYTVHTHAVDGTVCTEADAACTFDIIFANVKAFAGNNDIITVRYDAVLNEDAQINTANENESHVEFSNDPNYNGPEKDTPTGITPDKKVEVFTTSVEITKKSGATNAILTGAAFRIEGEKANIVITKGDVFVPYVSGTMYWKLDDGTYTTTDPATVADPSVYDDDVTKTYMLVHEEGLETKGSTPVYAEGFVGADGKISFTGLGVGTYKITEIVTPGGYNTIGEITLVVGFDPSTKTFTYAWSGGATGVFPDVTVLNYQGSVLPETGGMGTTLFYTIGGILVLAAVVLLMTKKRMKTA